MKPTRADEPAAATAGDAGEIEFRDLTFSFGDATPVLTHVSAHVPAGQTVALVGVTGSGKSTLISLLARLHDPPPGTVFLDGVDVRDLPLGVAARRDRLRAAGAVSLLRHARRQRRVRTRRESDAGETGGAGAGCARAGKAARSKRPRRSAVPRPSSVTERPRDGGDQRRGNHRMERILAAAAVARLDKDVADFPKATTRWWGSAASRCLAARSSAPRIARAVAIDPRILILDDALSAVDTYTEEEILSRLRDVMRQRTSIIVSHRVSTVRDADQILVLDKGRIVERGTHDELVRHNGLYAELHRKQLLEEELAAS